MSDSPEEREIHWLAVVETERDPEFFGPGTRESLLIAVRKSVEDHLRAKGQEIPPQLDAALTAGKNYYNRVLELKITYASESMVRD